MNRLARETSPYLRQHAQNPVDWFPWGDEAIAQARAQGKPLFVSIGYSTCYWCHVMERESFEVAAIGAQLAKDFVAVKVDREERPDVDDVMMAACQAYTAMTEGRASGGWPLTVFLEPDTLRPFFAGTYFPPAPSHGRPSFSMLLTAIATAWREQREAIRAQADALFAAVARSVDGEGTADGVMADGTKRVALEQLAIHTAEALVQFEDAQEGGFGGAPKFPQPAWLELLESVQGDLPSARATLNRALHAMVRGGVHDHLGGGFHRYAVDRSWRVPHFEKMLYDSALLIPLLAATGDPWLRRAARRSAEWMEREMLRADGLMHAAQDAEVDGREGLNFLWTAQEMIDAVGAEDGAWAATQFGLDAGTNFHDPHHPEAPPSNVLFLAEIPEISQWPRLDRVSAALLHARGARKQPRIDDKAILGWNALAIRALAEAGRLLAEPKFVARASAALDAAWSAFVEQNSRRDAVTAVFRVRRTGLPSYAAPLEDVALLAQATLTLATTTLDTLQFDRVWQLVDFATRVHLDGAQRWCERNATDEWGLRGRALQDGAVPSGAGTMAVVLATLASTGPRAKDAGALLRQTLDASRAALLDAPTEAARTLIAAYWASQYALPESVESLCVTGIGTERTLILTLARGWHVMAGDRAHPPFVLHGAGLSMRLPTANATCDGEPAFEGVVRLALSVDLGAREGVLRLQPCDATRCLASLPLLFRL